MKLCVTSKQMKVIEADAIERIGIPSLVLMERAAMAVVAAVVEIGNKSDRIWVLCGSGNNGADGIATARMLFEKGYLVTIVCVGDLSKATQEFMVQKYIVEALKVPCIELKDFMPIKEDLIVDALLGIGLSRAVSGKYKDCIEVVKDAKCQKVIAVDIASGLSADTGEVLGCAMHASTTVTFGYALAGLYLGSGIVYSGNIVVADIGFPKQCEGVVLEPMFMLEESDLCKIPERSEVANKGTYGRLLVIAGSEGMSGAAYLCAMSAYRMGAGLVKILTTESNRQVLQMQLPEAIVQTYKEENLGESVREACAWATSIVMGPGLSTKTYVKELVETVLSSTGHNVPIVLDSDALNTISEREELTSYYRNKIIITPHVKEMSRLTDLSVAQIKKDPIGVARAYSKKHGITCVLKDATSVIANGFGDLILNRSGNSALAKGGTGDVLAGMIGGLTCLSLSTMECASLGAFMHGRAGVKASDVLGKHGVMASDLLLE
ncbi:MAG: NAD(P)H-hydrate dehydratase [Lachnospiraceae bacterium]